MTAETQWATIESAVRAVVVSGTQVDDYRVFWDYHSQAPRPAPPCVELALDDLKMEGEDWVEYDDAPDPTPGAEVRVRVRGHRTVSLTIQAYGVFGHGNTAFKILSRFISSLALTQTNLDDAGVGLGDVGPVQSVGGKKGGVLEPRARCRLELYVASELEGRTTYIERFHLEVTVGPVTQTLWIPDPPP